VSFITVPLGVFTMIYAHEIVVAALGEKWLGAIVFLRIFGVAAAVLPALGTTGTILVSCGHSGRFFWVSLVNNALVVILMAIDVSGGAVGVAIARVSLRYFGSRWCSHSVETAGLSCAGAQKRSAAGTIPSFFVRFQQVAKNVMPCNFFQLSYPTTFLALLPSPVTEVATCIVCSKLK
jgi:hypothetical protein